MSAKLKAGFLITVLLLASVSAARAQQNACLAVMVDWLPLIQMVEQSFEDLEADEFQGLEHTFLHKGDCLKYAPTPWRLLPSAQLINQKMVRLLHRPLSLGQVDYVRGFLDDLNKARLIRGYERKKLKDGWQEGCTEVVFKLKVYGGLYALATSHLRRPWKFCPVKSGRTSRGLAEITPIGVKAE